MLKRKWRRLYGVALGLTGLGMAVALALVAFEDNLVFFYSPSDVLEKKIVPGQRVRLGGLVEAQSVRKMGDGLTVEFRVTDMRNVIPVTFRGVLPDLFREGQGVVAEGQLRGDGVFEARDVLAKHDEDYMPPEVVDGLKSAGQWQAARKVEAPR
mgnify:CR=1 FL=1